MKPQKKSLKLQTAVFLLIGYIIISACNSASSTSETSNQNSANTVLPDSAKDDCVNKVRYMFVTKDEIEKYTDDGNFLRIYLQFKTNDGIKFYGDSYGWLKGGTDYVKHFITPLDLTEDLNTLPYVLGNLELRKGDLKKITGVQLYLFEPFIDNDNYEKINYVNYKITAYTKKDLLKADSLIDNKTLDTKTVEKIVPILISQQSGRDAGKTNPCPPKTPDPNQ